jgi:hypothetical protein
LFCFVDFGSCGLASFEQDFLPFTGTGLQRVQPTQLTPLLIASILTVTSRSLSTPESLVYSRTFEHAFHLAFSELDTNADAEVVGIAMEADQRGCMNVFGLLIFCQAELGGKRSLSGHIAWAHQIILDSVGLGETVREEEWRTLWDALHVSEEKEIWIAHRCGSTELISKLADLGSATS